MNREEMLNFLKREARGIATMFGPSCETLVHDMTRPGHPVLAIYNGTVTGREVGSTADIFGDIGDYDESVYEKKDYVNQLVLSRDGRMLKSTTFNVVGEDYHFALGINVDITHMVRATQMLSELTATSGELQQTLMQDSRSQLEELLRECISARGQGARCDEKDRPHAHHSHALQAPGVYLSKIRGHCCGAAECVPLYGLQIHARA